MCFRVSEQTSGHSPGPNTVVYQPTSAPAHPPLLTLSGQRASSLSTENLQLYTIFIAVATVISFVLSPAVVEVMVAVAKSCHDDMLNAVIGAKVGVFLVSSAGEFRCLQ